MRSFVLLLSLLFVGCTNYGQLEYVAKLPKSLKESSGVEVISGSIIWSINDSGNEPVLIGLNNQGKEIRQLWIENAKNTDWEDLTKDDEGNLYIGDFGNNGNDRKDLTIYKVFQPEGISTASTTAEKITFYFPEQKDFPPKKSKRFYDVEAFFYASGNLYLFTRNRSTKFDGTTFCYRIPAEAGHHKATRLGSYPVCTKSNRCQVTSAAISPSRKQVVLLTHDSVWILSGYQGDDFLRGNIMQLPLEHFSQKEAVCFETENTLLITDEKDHTTGRNLYRFTLD